MKHVITECDNCGEKLELPLPKIDPGGYATTYGSDAVGWARIGFTMTEARPEGPRPIHPMARLGGKMLGFDPDMLAHLAEQAAPPASVAWSAFLELCPACVLKFGAALRGGGVSKLASSIDTQRRQGLASHGVALPVPPAAAAGPRDPE